MKFHKELTRLAQIFISCQLCISSVIKPKYFITFTHSILISDDFIVDQSKWLNTSTTIYTNMVLGTR